VDDRLVIYVITHLAEVVLAADLEAGSLYRTLWQDTGVRVLGGRRVVEAVTAQEELATLLKVEPGSPLLSWNRCRRTEVSSPTSSTGHGTAPTGPCRGAGRQPGGGQRPAWTRHPAAGDSLSTALVTGGDQAKPTS
jgi:hypothetical protein